MNDDLIYNEIQELLSEVEDPEVGINIVDLGLLYDIKIESHGITLVITLTSAACPLQEYIEEDIRNVLGTSEHITQPVFFQWTFIPAWSPALMSDEGREMFSALGGSLPTY